jgi:hypothetical protein
VAKFLAHTPIPFVNAQFAFCAFVAAKALLFEHQSTKVPLRPEFQYLVRSLRHMSYQWAGVKDGVNATKKTLNQAGMYANRLEDLHNACQKDAQFSFDLYDHSCKPLQQDASPVPMMTPIQHRPLKQKRPSRSQHVHHSSITSLQSALSPKQLPTITTTYEPVESPAMGQIPHHHQAQISSGLPPHLTPASYESRDAMDGMSHNIQPLYGTSAGVVAPNTATSHLQHAHRTHNETMQDQSLITLSDTLLGSQFLGMDRVITFEDANFFMPWE